MGPYEEAEASSRRRIVRTAFGLFMGLLALLTLFGNTLQSLALPKVRTETPIPGSLTYTLEGSGILKPAVQVPLTNSAGWKAAAVHVKEGERVKQGQLLIAYDSSAAERELEDETAQREKQKIDLQTTRERFIAAAQEGDEAKRRSASRDLEKGVIDLSVQERKIKQWTDMLASQKELTAPFDGIVTRVNAVAGLASAGEPDIVLSNESRGYRFEFAADALLLSNLGLAPEDSIQVEVTAAADRQADIMDGVVAELADAEPRADSPSSGAGGKSTAVAQKTVRVNVSAPGLKGGEQAHVKIVKRSGREGIKLANGAIRQDRADPFIYTVEERKGAWGNVFIARKIPIRPLETNGIETLIAEDGVSRNEQIIVESSEPLQDGNRVRLQ
ncbi:biotin/lipoyl-binding protein [Paenibacillus doosanensis]|uniref:HlyD family secretion protein n=1 Tax=Paenibacillus konkukensis TaxID=2020716 RepID=A0ABY4RFG0_9BACL|nr:MULTISPECIES: biotin/lipoyl-binding protein [Paenibacillus]MCS7461358.1 biotin/lipoyl-binding protein [Paenibacillus doosanensis]UQZ81123.1 HlyD family secretion protein [Paenibacillus konkukensis]